MSQQKEMELSGVTLCLIVKMKNLVILTLKPQKETCYTVDVLGGATYQFRVRAATIKPGPNATLSLAVNGYGRCKSENIIIN